MFLHNNTSQLYLLSEVPATSHTGGETSSSLRKYLLSEVLATGVPGGETSSGLRNGIL